MPSVPNKIGIVTLAALMAIRRRPSASPWRTWGVIWCSVLITMGCTAPKKKPNNTEQAPMANGSFMNG